MMATDETQIGRNRLWQLYSQRRFAILLAILVGLLAGPSLFTRGRSPEWFDIIMSLLMLAAILSLCFEHYQRLIALLFAVPAIGFGLAGHSVAGIPSSAASVLAQLCDIAFYLGAASLIVRSLFNRDDVTFDSMLGAVCGYLFVGLGWAFCYSLIESFYPGSFALGDSLAAHSDRELMLPQLLVYYSFVTLTTVGYGDVSPVSAPARTFSWMEAIAGQFYLEVVVASLVSLIVASKKPSKSRQ